MPSVAKSTKATVTKKASAEKKPIAKRHAKSKPLINGLTPQTVKRIARKVGVTRMKKNLPVQVQNFAKRVTEEATRLALVRQNLQGRSTVVSSDVTFAAEQMGTTIYDEERSAVLRRKQPKKKDAETKAPSPSN